MSLLFDISPEDVPNKRKQKKRRTEEAPQPQKPEFSPPKPAAIVTLGKLDGIHACENPSCRGSAHDILYESDGEWMIQCCFCLWMQWVPVIEGHLKEEFRLSEGIFAGMALREIAARDRGMDYIKLQARKHKSQRVREECSSWLDQNCPEA
jgi:hypothetical protein